LFAGTSGGVFQYDDATGWWTNATGGLVSTEVRSLVIIGDEMYAGTLDRGVWRRPLAEFATEARSVPSAPADGFALEQNYPNPFNPTTTINYHVPTTTFISLAVYDLHGRKLATLVNEPKSPGAYQVQFDGSGLASGVYSCRLHADGVTLARWLVLEK
jgi:hypothetical protein